ncbi:MAG: DNA repair protein RecN [Dongiaceae bacterium]
MLTALSIRDVVLIEALDLTLEDGLTTLTGETGAGKSILLDALGLALGTRAESGLVRTGTEKATVSATFQLGLKHPARAFLEEHGLNTNDEEIILRRVLNADGRSRAFINDQPVGVHLLKEIGAYLVEIHGQFENHGLLNAATHRQLLDVFAGLESDVEKLSGLYRDWQNKNQALLIARENFAKAQKEEEFLRHAAKELQDWDPKKGEEEKLAIERAQLMNRDKIVIAAQNALDELEGETGAIPTLARAQKILHKSGAGFDTVAGNLERSLLEAGEAAKELEKILSANQEPNRLEIIEERLFGLRELARKYQVTPDDLAAKCDEFKAQLSALNASEENIEELEKQTSAARQAYINLADKIHEARHNAAGKLAKAVVKELTPLKLGAANFTCAVNELPPGQWNANGKSAIQFLVAINPGAAPGALNKIASGGELARLMLALKVVLHKGSVVATLIFDEIDTGIGGAVADAVGERLAKLGDERQVLVVTHSPQIAAQARHHWRIEKTMSAKAARTAVKTLTASERREEIARMLAGAEITNEARAAATKLLGAA